MAANSAERPYAYWGRMSAVNDLLREVGKVGICEAEVCELKASRVDGALDRVERRIVGGRYRFGRRHGDVAFGAGQHVAFRDAAPLLEQQRGDRSGDSCVVIVEHPLRERLCVVARPRVARRISDEAAAGVRERLAAHTNGEHERDTLALPVEEQQLAVENRLGDLVALSHSHLELDRVGPRFEPQVGELTLEDGAGLSGRDVGLDDGPLDHELARRVQHLETHLDEVGLAVHSHLRREGVARVDGYREVLGLERRGGGAGRSGHRAERSCRDARESRSVGVCRGNGRHQDEAGHQHDQPGEKAGHSGGWRAWHLVGLPRGEAWAKTRPRTCTMVAIRAQGLSHDATKGPERACHRWR